jgi:hypothetical protein
MILFFFVTGYLENSLTHNSLTVYLFLTRVRAHVQNRNRFAPSLVSKWDFGFFFFFVCGWFGAGASGLTTFRDPEFESILRWSILAENRNRTRGPQVEVLMFTPYNPYTHRRSSLRTFSGWCFRTAGTTIVSTEFTRYRENRYCYVAVRYSLKTANVNR